MAIDILDPCSRNRGNRIPVTCCIFFEKFFHLHEQLKSTDSKCGSSYPRRRRRESHVALLLENPRFSTAFGLLSDTGNSRFPTPSQFESLLILTRRLVRRVRDSNSRWVSPH